MIDEWDAVSGGERLGVLYPLAHAKPYVANKELVLEIQEETGLDHELPMVTLRRGQLVLASGAAAFVEKVEFAPGDGPALRLVPDDRKSPVAIDLRRAFGAPAIRGIRTMKTFARQGVVRARGKLRCDVPSGSP